jgi:hypothetical protein
MESVHKVCKQRSDKTRFIVLLFHQLAVPVILPPTLTNMCVSKKVNCPRSTGQRNPLLVSKSLCIKTDFRDLLQDPRRKPSILLMLPANSR